MKQRIIAAALAVLMVALSFSACGKKNTIIAKNGQEYEVVTDENGENVIGPDGDVAVYQKDKDGKYVKDENGEKNIVYVDFPDAVAEGLEYETPYFKLTMPKGWKNVKDKDGAYVKADNEKITFTVDQSSSLNDKFTMEKYVEIQLNAVDSMNEMTADKQKIEYKVQDCAPITDAKRRCLEIHMMVKDTAGENIAEQFLYYIDNNTKMLRFSYICEDPAQLGTFNGYAFLQDNVNFKPVPAKTEAAQ